MKIHKLIAHITIAIALSLSLVSCGDKQSDNESTVEKPTTEASSLKPYSLDTCLVSGEKLGSMGAPYVFEHEGLEIKMCCKRCLKKFNNNTAKYLAMLAEEKTDHSAHNSHEH